MLWSSFIAMSLQSSLSKDNKRKFKKLISYNFAKIKFLLETKYLKDVEIMYI